MDKEITCPCGNNFTFTVNDQQFFKEKGYNLPKYCKSCREKRKNERAEKEI